MMLSKSHFKGDHRRLAFVTVNSSLFRICVARQRELLNRMNAGKIG